MNLPVDWRETAQADLLELYDWLATLAGQDAATAYTDAVVAHVARLADLPGWGSPRDDLAPGIRTISYRRRTTIAYRQLEDKIEIVHLAHGGRDLGRDFVEADDL